MATKTDKSIYLDTSQPATRRKLYRAIRTLPKGIYAVDPARKRLKPSDLQRGYYYGYLLVEGARLTGLSKDKADRLLCSLFLTSSVEVSGEPIKVVLLSSDLDPFGAADYYEDVRGWVFRKYGFKLSEPNPILRKSK